MFKKVKYIFGSVIIVLFLVFLYAWVMSKMQSLPYARTPEEQAYVEKTQREYESKLKRVCVDSSAIACQKKPAQPR